MVSNFGVSLMNGGMHHAYRGRGISRRVAGSVLNTLGHALINRTASAVSGSGYRHKRRTIHRRRHVTTGSLYRLTEVEDHVEPLITVDVD